MSFITALLNSLPGAAAQGLIWGLMAIGVYITFRILDIADLTVDGSFATGGAVAVMLIRAGVNPWLALNTNDLKLLTALIVALFLSVPHWKSRLHHQKQKKEAAPHA